MIQAIVFDFDGLILETEHPQWRAWRDVFAAYGRPLPESAWLEVMGKPVGIERFPRRLAAELGRELDIPAVIEQYREVVAGHLAEQPTQPGVRELIDDAKAMGLKRAVASGSSHRWVDGHLKRLGLFDAMMTTVCAEDTERHKPDPDPYLLACSLLEAEPTKTLALEDTALGVTAAKAAGMYTVAVPTHMTDDQDFTHSDIVLSRLDERPLRELLRKLENGKT